MHKIIESYMSCKACFMSVHRNSFLGFLALTRKTRNKTTLKSVIQIKQKYQVIV